LEPQSRKKGEPAPGGTPRSLLWRLAPFAAIALLVALFFATGLHRAFGVEAIMAKRDWLRAYVDEHPVRAGLYYVLIYVAFVSVSLPGAWWLSVMGGFLFGWLLGGALAVVSGTIGAVAIFLAARTSVGGALARRAGPKIQRFLAGFKRNAFSYLLLMRLIPLIPFWVNNIAPALVGARLGSFAAATFLGIIPVTFAFAAAGEGLDATMAAGSEAREACLAQGRADCAPDIGLADVVTTQTLIAFAVIGALSALPILLRRRFPALDGGARTP